MHLQRNLLTETPSTNVAGMHRQHRVLSPPVELQGTLPIERLPAQLALKWSLVRVAHLVIQQLIPGNERLRTVGTNVVLHHRMLPAFVHLEIAREPEMITTKVAHEGLALGVGQHVLLKATLLGC